MTIELDSVRRRLSEQLRDLEQLAVQAQRTDSRDAYAVGEYCIVQLLDVWNRFVRDVILVSATGRAVDRHGKSVSAGPPGGLRGDAAVAFLRVNWPKSKKPAHWEPSWFDVSQSNAALDLLLPSNAQDLKTALGSTTNPVEELRMLRNFCAHRGPISAGRLHLQTRHWGPTNWNQPHDMVVARGPAGLPSIFEDWCGAFRLVGSAVV